MFLVLAIFRFLLMLASAAGLIGGVVLYWMGMHNLGGLVLLLSLGVLWITLRLARPVAPAPRPRRRQRWVRDEMSDVPLPNTDSGDRSSVWFDNGAEACEALDRMHADCERARSE